VACPCSTFFASIVLRIAAPFAFSLKSSCTFGAANAPTKGREDDREDQ